MPQFDPTFFSSQLVWLVVAFVVLYVLMTLVTMPKIGNVLEERQRRIDDNLDKATQLKAEADAAMAVYQKALAESTATAQRILRDSSDALAREAEQRQRELGERLAAQIKDGEARIAVAKTQALAHVRDIAIDVARTATEKLVGVAPVEGQLADAVAAQLKEGR